MSTGAQHLPLKMPELCACICDAIEKLRCLLNATLFVLHMHPYFNMGMHARPPSVMASLIRQVESHQVDQTQQLGLSYPK